MNSTRISNIWSNFNSNGKYFSLFYSCLAPKWINAWIGRKSGQSYSGGDVGLSYAPELHFTWQVFFWLHVRIFLFLKFGECFSIFKVWKLKFLQKADQSTFYLIVVVQTWVWNTAILKNNLRVFVISKVQLKNNWLLMRIKAP